MSFMEDRLVPRQDILYKFEGIDPDEGVDVYSLAPYLMKFGDLVRETARELGNDKPIDVKVKPFERGSFITEFVLQGQGIIDLFSGDAANAITNALTVLGFITPSAYTLPEIVRTVRGNIHDNKKNPDGTVTYGQGDDAITVPDKVSKVVQSSVISGLYKDVAVGPFGKFEANIGKVIICSPTENDAFEGAVFTEADKGTFDRYHQTTLEDPPEEEDESVSEATNVLLVPLAGPYDGTQNGYTFRLDENIVYRKVKIEDEDFRKRLESTEVRFATGDVLTVDMRITQHVTKSGTVRSDYAITKVKNYVPYKSPDQSDIFNPFE